MSLTIDFYEFIHFFLQNSLYSYLYQLVNALTYMCICVRVRMCVSKFRYEQYIALKKKQCEWWQKQTFLYHRVSSPGEFFSFSTFKSNVCFYYCVILLRKTCLSSTDRSRNEVIKFIKDHELKITTTANVKLRIFHDVTLNLSTGK